MSPLQPFQCSVIVVKGCICTSKSANDMSRHAFLLWEQGDMIHAENILTETDPLHEIWHYHALMESYVAVFNPAILKDLFFHSTTFSSTLFLSMIKTRERQTQFLLGSQLQNAKQSIMFVILYGKENHYPPLSHQQIAYLCGLDRTTVTKTLKLIIQQENLEISSQEYLKKIVTIPDPC